MNDDELRRAANAEKEWWFPKRVDAALVARLRKDYPEDAELSDGEILAKYEYDGKRFATTWDHLGDAQDQFDRLADAYLQLRDAYLAKHPADGGELVTEEWLAEFMGDYGEWTGGLADIRVWDFHDALLLEWNATAQSTRIITRAHFATVVRIKTRRQLRSLVAALRGGGMKAPDKHPCAWARRVLDEIVELDRRDRDALPVSVVKLIKEARRILIRRQKDKPATNWQAELD